MALFLQSKKGGPTYNPGETKCQHYRQSFVYVDSIDRSDLNPTLKTLHGTRSFHCVETPVFLELSKSVGHLACAG